MAKGDTPPMEFRSSSPRDRWVLAALAWAALIVYGSLYPFSGWTLDVRPFAFLTPRWSDHLSRSDVVTNVLAYTPLGVALSLWLRGLVRALPASAIALVVGASLSFGMEFAQQFLPGRVAALSDLVANTLGTAFGAAMSRLIQESSLPWTMLVRCRHRWFAPGRAVDLGLAAIGLWVCSQWAPFVPSLDVGNLRQGLSPIRQTLQHPALFNAAQWETYTCYIAALALLSARLGFLEQAALVRFFAFAACILVGKVAIVTRQLSLEAVGGAMAALFLSLLLLALRRQWLCLTSAALVVAGFVISELAPIPGGVRWPFNWVPFAAQLDTPLSGIVGILEDVWPTAALSALARLGTPQRHQRMVAVLGLAAIGVLTFVLERHQQDLPGRHGDITVVLLSVATWVAFWMVPVTDRQPHAAAIRRCGTRNEGAAAS